MGPIKYLFYFCFILIQKNLKFKYNYASTQRVIFVFHFSIFCYFYLDVNNSLSVLSIKCYCTLLYHTSPFYNKSHIWCERRVLRMVKNSVLEKLMEYEIHIFILIL